MKRTVVKNRVYKKTNRKVAPTLVAAIKKVTRGQAETKSSYNVETPGNVFNDLVYALNLNYLITQGVSAQDVIGEKIFLKNIHLKVLMSSLNTTTATNGRLNYRLCVIKTKKLLTTSYSTVTTTDVFRASQNPATLGMVDLHKVDLLYDGIKSIMPPSIANNNDSVSTDINIPINRTHFFDQDSSGVFKDKNYFLIWTAQKPDAPLANVGFLKTGWTVNFKDE